MSNDIRIIRKCVFKNPKSKRYYIFLLAAFCPLPRLSLTLTSFSWASTGCPCPSVLLSVLLSPQLSLLPSSACSLLLWPLSSSGLSPLLSSSVPFPPLSSLLVFFSLLFPLLLSISPRLSPLLSPKADQTRTLTDNVDADKSAMKISEWRRYITDLLSFNCFCR